MYKSRQNKSNRLSASAVERLLADQLLALDEQIEEKKRLANPYISWSTLNEIQQEDVMDRMPIGNPKNYEYLIGDAGLTVRRRRLRQSD